MVGWLNGWLVGWLDGWLVPTACSCGQSWPLFRGHTTLSQSPNHLTLFTFPLYYLRQRQRFQLVSRNTCTQMWLRLKHISLWMIITLNCDSERTIRTDYSHGWFEMQFLSPHTLLLHPVILCHRKIEQDTQSTYNETLRRVRAIRITYSECMFVSLRIQHAMCMRYVVTFDLPGSTILFHIIW